MTERKDRILWLGGNHKRHLYYINHIADRLNVVGGIMQVREHSIPKAPEGLPNTDRWNWDLHFRRREEKEQQYFGEQHEPDIPLLKVDAKTLNDDDAVKFAKEAKPDLAIIFGTGMIREPLMSALPKDTINLHLGLSPRYRGAATLFWPFYFLEPNFAGTTFHYIENSPDAGDIIHQVTPKLEWSDKTTNDPAAAYRTYAQQDGIHDVACKAIVRSTIEAVALFEMRPRWKKYPQRPEAGKNFLQSDFKPQHLRMIYQEYNNDIVRAYLDGEIKPKEPKLKRQW